MYPFPEIAYLNSTYAILPGQSRACEVGTGASIKLPDLHAAQINIAYLVLLCYDEFSEIAQLMCDSIANGYLLRWYFSMALARRGCPLLKLCHVL